MKKKELLLLALVCVYVAFSFTACKKKDADEPDDPPALTVTDANGNVYNTVQIANQTWMASNIKVNVQGSYDYNGDASITSTYGKLYTWDAAKLACPSGWRLPTEADFVTLVTALGGDDLAGGKMKNAGTAYWQTPNTGGNNASGYNALPAGYRNNNDGTFFGKGMYTYFWTSTNCST